MYMTRISHGWRCRLVVLLFALMLAGFASADVRFTGRLFYRDTSGLALPSRFVRVNVLDENYGAQDSWQFSAYTDASGNFDFTVPTKSDTGPLDSGLIDPYLMVVASMNPDVGYRLEVRGIGEMTGYPYTGGWTFSSTYFDAVGTINLGNVVLDHGVAGTSDANIEKAFQVFDYAATYLANLKADGFEPVNGFYEAGYRLYVRDVADTGATVNSSSYGSMSQYVNYYNVGYDFRYPTSTLNKNDVGRQWVIARALAFQHFYWMDYIPFSGNGTFNSRASYAFLGLGVYPSESTSFEGPVNEVQAWVEGYTTYLASLMMNSTVSQRWNASGTLLTYDIEANWDGIGTANANTDGASDANLSGRFQPAAVAGFLQDVFDNSSTGSDPYDNSSAASTLLNFLFSGATARLDTPQAFIEQWTTRGYESLPMIYGAAQIHGMTQNRITRPTIALTALSASGTPWFWNGPASGSMTVFNYGSQPFSFFDATRSLDLSLRNPLGAAYLPGPMLGTSSTVSPIAGGASRVYSPSVTQIWPSVFTTGNYQLQANCYYSDGSLRKLMTVKGGPTNPILVPVGYTGVPPIVAVTDPAEYQVSRTSLAIGVTATGSGSPITKYEVALGTSPGLTNIAGWKTITSSATSINTTFTGLSVTAGTRVYATAKVTNSESLIGTANSDGIVMGDPSPPECTIDDLGDYQGETNSATFRTTASDSNGALTKIEYCLSTEQDYSGDIAAWTTYATYPVSSLTRSANLLITVPGLVLPVGQPYYVGVRWTNAEGFVRFALSDGKYVLSGSYVTGHVVLEGLANPGDISAFPVTFTFTDVSGAVVQVETINVLASGAYALPILRADATRLSAKVPFLGLRKRLDLSPSTLGSMDFTLKNGDCDGDNSVSVFDYIILSNAFDQSLGDPGYQFEADCDLDGTVSVFDYIILSGNFDVTGDDL